MRLKICTMHKSTDFCKIENGYGYKWPKLIELHEKFNIPVVATCDCHYINKEDNVAQDIMLCIQTGKNLDDTGRISMMNSDYSMRDPEELYEVFSHIPEALENTVKIANRCNVKFEFGKYLIPAFPTPESKDPAQHLKELCFHGLVGDHVVQATGSASSGTVLS